LINLFVTTTNNSSAVYHSSNVILDSISNQKMGNPWFKDDIGQMCFNPAKTWQIATAGAWYDTKYTLTWESGTKDPNYWRVNLIGLADYTSISQNHALVVKLETGGEKDYFVGFNRAYGINKDSKLANDKVTIIEAGNNGKGYSKSLMVAMLDVSQSHVFDDWRGSGKALVVNVRNILNSSNPWLASVEFNFNNALSPTDSPSKKPTLSPVTKSPSRKPMLGSFPSKKPSPHPTFMLTSLPTFSPTDGGESGPPVTSSPTRECGDMICMPYETIVDCPEDCAGVEFATYDANIGAKGANGEYMFVLQVS
jgi:hypothetical protein